MTAVPVRRKESSAPYVAHQKRPPFAQIKRPTTWKEKVVVVKDCAVWWWIALPEQKWVKISECHRHEGKTWVESAAGSGSTFFVELPQVRAERPDDESFEVGMN